MKRLYTYISESVVTESTLTEAVNDPVIYDFLQFVKKVGCALPGRLASNFDLNKVRPGDAKTFDLKNDKEYKAAESLIRRCLRNNLGFFAISQKDNGEYVRLSMLTLAYLGNYYSIDLTTTQGNYFPAFPAYTDTQRGKIYGVLSGADKIVIYSGDSLIQDYNKQHELRKTRKELQQGVIRKEDYEEIANNNRKRYENAIRGLRATRELANRGVKDLAKRVNDALDKFDKKSREALNALADPHAEQSNYKLYELLRLHTKVITRFADYTDRLKNNRDGKYIYGQDVIDSSKRDVETALELLLNRMRDF